MENTLKRNTEIYNMNLYLDDDYTWWTYCSKCSSSKFIGEIEKDRYFCDTCGSQLNVCSKDVILEKSI